MITKKIIPLLAVLLVLTAASHAISDPKGEDPPPIPEDFPLLGLTNDLESILKLRDFHFCQGSEEWITETEEDPEEEVPVYSKEYYYYYFHQKVLLTLVKEQVFARTKNQQLASVFAAKHLYSDSYLIDVPNGQQKDIPGFVDYLLSKGFDFAGPVFYRNEDPSQMILSPTRKAALNFNEDVSQAEIQTIIQPFQVIEEKYGGFGTGSYLLESAHLNGFEVLEQINDVMEKNYKKLIFCEPNRYMQGESCMIPSDPEFVHQWGLHNTGIWPAEEDVDIDAPEAWETTTGDQGLIVAVLDVGVQFDHPDLSIGYGLDFTSQNPGGDGSPFSEFDSHGTLCAGVIAALMNNENLATPEPDDYVGMVGVAPDVTIASARMAIADPVGPTIHLEDAWVVNALDWVRCGLHMNVWSLVTNNSYMIGYGRGSAQIAHAFYETHRNGRISFAGSGNDGINRIAFPANLSTVNAVGAIDSAGNRAGFSCHGDGLDIVAPGVDIFTLDLMGGDGTSPDDYQPAASGTSMATAFASGVAALMLSEQFLSPWQLGAIIRNTAVDLGPEGRDEEYGCGLINARRSLEVLTQPLLMRNIDDAHSIDSCGDFNNDGTPDFIAAYPDPADPECGFVWIYSGLPPHYPLLSLHTFPDPPWEEDMMYPYTVGYAGDVNNDQVDDFYIGFPMYHDYRGAEHHIGKVEIRSGETGLLLDEVTHACNFYSLDGYGFNVSTAGDFDGDGCDDIVIGAPLAESSSGLYGAGRAYVYSVKKEEVLFEIEGSRTFAMLGFAVSDAGDYNGDGFDDIAIGAPGCYWWGTTGCCLFADGEVAVISGEDHSYLLQYILNPGFGIGRSVSNVGDTDGDGTSDLIAGAPNAGFNRGMAFVFTHNYQKPEKLYFGSDIHEYFGWCVKGLGDFDADGHNDYAIGIPGWYNDDLMYGYMAGAIRIYSGKWRHNDELVFMQGAGFHSQIGWHIGGGPDINGNGFSDFTALTNRVFYMKGVARFPDKDYGGVYDGGAAIRESRVPFPITLP